MRRFPATAFMVATLFLSPAFAQTNPNNDQSIYGSPMMTPQERDEYRRKMSEAQTAEARERLRQEHHSKMTERAKERGIILPDEPPAGRGPGGWSAGPGGPGPAMGPTPGPIRGRQ